LTIENFQLTIAHAPSAEKSVVYECGEPTIGSSWVQFDRRFYIIALVYLIFDVEVALFIRGPSPMATRRIWKNRWE
jgi:NADH:ubiquinone oxidoreductase subunit 3 (subunit A)